MTGGFTETYHLPSQKYWTKEDYYLTRLQCVLLFNSK